VNYGLYLSASGVLTNLYRQDVFANNLANVNTTGFKPDVATVRQRPPETMEDPHLQMSRHELLDRLGGGVFAGPQSIDFSPGTLKRSGRRLDAALSDKQSFFSVRTVDRATGEVTEGLTRDGRFTRNATGHLATPSGQLVLDAGGQPIEIPENSEAYVDGSGRIRTGEHETLARLGIKQVSDLNRLVKQGDNLLTYAGPDEDVTSVDQPHVHPGYIESSGVNPIKALTQMIGATKSATGNAQLIQYHDNILSQAVGRLGRVA